MNEAERRLKVKRGEGPDLARLAAIGSVVVGIIFFIAALVQICSWIWPEFPLKRYLAASTSTPTSTPTPTLTSASSPTLIPTSTATDTPPSTPVPTNTATNTPSPADALTPTLTPTAALTPTPTPTATPIPPDAVVNTEALNLHSGPDEVYDVLGELKQGDPLTVMGKCPDGDWLKVTYNDGQEGWAACSLLQVNVDMAGVPVVEVPLLPAPILLEPEAGEGDFTGSVDLKWQWICDLKEDEVYSLRVWRRGEPQALCHHATLKITEYSGDLSSCRTGEVCWWVAVARKLPEGSPSEWEDVSENSEARCFSYHAVEPEPDGGGEEGGGDGEAPEPPW